MNTGIISYGVAVPKYRIESGEIWKVWKNIATSFFDLLSISERGVLGPEEDTLTLAAAAARQALERSSVEPGKIGAVLLGTGTSPYATKAAATVLIDALGLPSSIVAADVLYEARNLRPIAAFVRTHLPRHGVALISDANRSTADPFADVARAAGLRVRMTAHEVARSGQTPAGARIFELCGA